MKDYDWSHKMKPSEYKKVKAWCNENGYKEYNMNLCCTDFADLCKYTFKGDGYIITIESCGNTFVNTHTRFIYVQVCIRVYKTLSVGFMDSLSVCRYVSTLEELKSLVAKIDKFVEIAKEFGV